MAFTAEQKREHRARRKAEGAPVKGGKTPRKPPRRFIAIDGEGATAGERHYYNLLAASTGDEVGTPDGELSSVDCLAFLLDLKQKHGNAIYCGFGLGYDFEFWVKDFGPKTWKSLAETKEAKVRVGRYGDCIIQVFHRKFFRIGFHKGGRFVPLITVFDLFGFFQTSFAKAIAEWGIGTEEERAVINEWKSRRGDFSPDLWDDIRAYNALECKLLVEMAGRLREALQEADMVPSSWHGPGAVVNLLMRRHGMDAYIPADLPPDVHEAQRCAYFGGRFQVFRLGHHPGVYDYDLSSAYPWGTTLLPSATGTWEKVAEWQESAPWTVYRVTWSDCLEEGFQPFLAPFPWRDKQGCIHYPPHGEGWYWAVEVEAARRKWGDKIVIHEGWRLYPEKEEAFAWVKELAEKRVAAKHGAKAAEKAGDAEEASRLGGVARAYKLALNSVYGKTIQTVGDSPWLCPFWAGVITANTRARLMNSAIDAGTENLVCFATDGLFTSRKFDISPYGNGLGEWELVNEKAIPLRIYQSGCYAGFNPDGSIRHQTARFRGLSALSEVRWDALESLWERVGTAGVWKVEVKRFIGYKQALAWKKSHWQASWQKVEKEVLLHPGVGFHVGNNVWYTFDPGTVVGCSHPHRKLPRGEAEEEQELAEVND